VWAPAYFNEKGTVSSSRRRSRIVSNVAFVALFLLTRIYVLLIQYAVFMTINIVGGIEWTRASRGRP
jgi:Flp pilus assembly protein TadB